MESRKASVKHVADQMSATINESKIIVWSVMDQVFVITINDGAAAKYVRVEVSAPIKK
jgi:adenosine/AMP kinase